MSRSKAQAAAIAADAMRIMSQGHYTNLQGEIVEISTELKRAQNRTISYPPDAALPPISQNRFQTIVEVTNESTLRATERLARQGDRVVALNFASAKNPGGGFLGGALAQEESLCRSSGLYKCIVDDPMYTYHARQGGGFYSDSAIYSPDVPVFFTDEGLPLPRPYLCSFITAPAVNAGVFLNQRPGLESVVHEEMARRISKVLTIAAGHAHEVIILGAWGCGVFRNDPRMMAMLFFEALTTSFHGVFQRVVFAVLDMSTNGEQFQTFLRTFANIKAL